MVTSSGGDKWWRMNFDVDNDVNCDIDGDGADNVDDEADGNVESDVDGDVWWEFLVASGGIA